MGILKLLGVFRLLFIRYRMILKSFFGRFFLHLFFSKGCFVFFSKEVFLEFHGEFQLSTFFFFSALNIFLIFFQRRYFWSSRENFTARYHVFITYRIC